MNLVILKIPRNLKKKLRNRKKMKQIPFLIALILLSIFFESSLSDDLLSPPTSESSETVKDSSDEKNPGSNDRKSAKKLEETNEEDENKKNIEPDNFDQFSKYISEGLNFPGSAIKIIKAPDLSKDKDSKKVSETISLLLENQEKWIQKIESELDDLNKKEEENSGEPPKEKTPDEIEGK